MRLEATERLQSIQIPCTISARPLLNQTRRPFSSLNVLALHYDNQRMTPRVSTWIPSFLIYQLPRALLHLPGLPRALFHLSTNPCTRTVRMPDMLATPLKHTQMATDRPKCLRRTCPLSRRVCRISDPHDCISPMAPLVPPPTQPIISRGQSNVRLCGSWTDSWIVSTYPIIL